MPVTNCEFRTRGAGERKMLRAATALSVALLLSPVCTSNASAQLPAAPGTSIMSTLQAAVGADADIDAITDLKARYFQNVDAKDWAALRELLAPDVVVDTTGSLGPVFHGRDAFVGFLKVTLGALDTHHQGYDPDITLTSPTSAEVVWTMEDRLVFNDIIGIHGYGHYRDRYEKVGDTWVIDYSKLTRTGIKIILPGLEHFVAGFAETLRSSGPIAAIRFTVDAILHRNTAASAPAPADDARTQNSPIPAPAETSTAFRQHVDKAAPATDARQSARSDHAAATAAPRQPRKARHDFLPDTQALSDPRPDSDDDAESESGGLTTNLDGAGKTDETEETGDDRGSEPDAKPEEDSRDEDDNTTKASTTATGEA